MILVTSPRKYKVGDKYLIAFNAARGLSIDPPQPSIVVRVATRDEYRQYHLNSDYAHEFRNAERDHGSVPIKNNFYEVITD